MSLSGSVWCTGLSAILEQFPRSVGDLTKRDNEEVRGYKDGQGTHDKESFTTPSLSNDSDPASAVRTRPRAKCRSTMTRLLPVGHNVNMLKSPQHADSQALRDAKNAGAFLERDTLDNFLYSSLKKLQRIMELGDGQLDRHQARSGRNKVRACGHSLETSTV